MVIDIFISFLFFFCKKQDAVNNIFFGGQNQSGLVQEAIPEEQAEDQTTELWQAGKQATIRQDEEPFLENRTPFITSETRSVRLFAYPIGVLADTGIS